MIRAAYITAFLFCQLFASNEKGYQISFEYWLNEDLRIFAVDNVITLEVEDDAIYLSSNNWFGETLLDEEIEYDNQPLLQNSICLLYTSPSPRDKRQSRMPSSA